jgi:hypothetical protein
MRPLQTLAFKEQELVEKYRAKTAEQGSCRWRAAPGYSGRGNMKLTCNNKFMVLSIASLVHAVLVPAIVFVGLSYNMDIDIQHVAIFTVSWVAWIPLVSWACHWEFKRLSVPLFIGFLLILPSIPQLLMYILLSIAYTSP